jgi:hypothetical protein
MAISNIRNSWLRKIICVTFYLPFLVVIVLFGAVRGLAEAVAQYNGAVAGAWKGN